MATVLAIDSRTKRVLGAPVRPNDFEFHEVGLMDSSCVLEDLTLSLYCIDPVGRCAFFTRTPSEVDLTQAAFLYQTQYQTATELVAVPFAELHRLAAAADVPSDRLVFVQSTGRCGSTLVSRALAIAEDVVSLSEPDVYYQLHNLRDDGDPEFDALMKSCTIILCAPRPANLWALKFRSLVIELAEPLLQAFPQAKTIFIYRNADSYARSAARAFGFYRPDVMDNWVRFSSLFGRCRSMVDGPVPAYLGNPAVVMAWLWATSMARAMAMQAAGVPMFVARYEELKERPEEVLGALLTYCGATYDPLALAQVLGRDAQEGTVFSRAEADRGDSAISAEGQAAFRRFLAEVVPGIAPGMVLPGTYGVASV